MTTKKQARANARIAKASAAKRGDMLRGRGSGKTEYTKEGGQRQHETIAERAAGRKIQVGEVVHHKDGNKKNNDPSNLQIKPRTKHVSDHRKA